MDRLSFLKRSAMTVAAIAVPKAFAGPPTAAVANPEVGTVLTAIETDGSLYARAALGEQWNGGAVIFNGDAYSDWRKVGGWMLHDNGKLLAEEKFEPCCVIGPGDVLKLTIDAKYE